MCWSPLLQTIASVQVRKENDNPHSHVWLQMKHFLPTLHRPVLNSCKSLRSKENSALATQAASTGGFTAHHTCFVGHTRVTRRLDHSASTMDAHLQQLMKMRIKPLWISLGSLQRCVFHGYRNFSRLMPTVNTASSLVLIKSEENLAFLHTCSNLTAISGHCDGWHYGYRVRLLIFCRPILPLNSRSIASTYRICLQAPTS